MIVLLAACGPEVEGVSVEISPEVATVATVRWTTSEPTVGHVVFGDGLATPPETQSATEHEAVLVGLAADTTSEARVVLEDGTESDPVEVSTGSLPAALPELTVTGEGGGAWMAVPILGATTAPVILSPAGDVVWYRLDERELDVYRVRLARDGASVLYNAASVSGDASEDSAIVRVSLDGATETTVDVPLLAHDFVELPDGTLAAIVVVYDGELRGDSIVEVAPDGARRTVWTSWDCFDPAATPGDTPETGWTFANALDYDEEADAYTLGMRNLSSIARVDRATGACAWVMGNDAATVTFAEGSSPFLHQHQFQLLGDGDEPDGLVVFDNEGEAGTVSRVQEYAVDLDAGTLTEVWSHAADPPVYSFVLGDVHRFDDGDTLVTWSVGGQIQRVTPDGDVTFQVNTAVGYAFGFDTVLENLY